MNIFKSKYLYLPILSLALLCIQYFLNNDEFLFQKTTNDSIILSYGSQKINLTPIQKHLSIPVNQLNWSRLASPTSFIINENRESAYYLQKVDIFVENESKHATFSTSAMDQELWETIYDKFGNQATLYIKVTDVEGSQYAAVLSQAPTEGLHTQQIMLNSFYDFESLSIDNTTVRSTFNRNALRIPLHTIQDESLVPLTYLTNEIAQSNIECEIELSGATQDNLHVLVKSGHGNMRKVCFEVSEIMTLKTLLAHHVEETTIYFCSGSPTSVDRQLGILVVSDQKKLLAVQPTLLNKLVGISMNDIVFDHVEFSPVDIDFVWGDIELRLTKNKEGNYHAKKRIGKSKWDKSIHGSPNLLMGKSLHMDSLSFDFSIATQDKDTVNELRIENVHANDFGNSMKLNLSDTLLSANSHKSIIRLDQIQNDGMDSASISLELEIYDDSPKTKEKKYQLHWGDIDTTLTQKEKKKHFSESLSMSIDQFNQLLEKEPVLTSSQRGVLAAFSYELVHKRAHKRLQSKRVKTNIKNPKVFDQLMGEFTLDNKILIGDEFVLQDFSGEELPKQEQLRFEILIDNDKQEEESIDDSNVFLNWGSSILKTTPLLDNSRKNKIQDQIVERKNLWKIINQPAMLNRFGVKEAIINAEWFINDDIYTQEKCETEWKECFANYIKKAKSGDFVSLFLRTKNGNGAICQFYLDKIQEEDIIGFGNTEFDSLLFKYAKQTYRIESKPKYNYDFIWGESEFALELKGNPRVFGGQHMINQRDLEDLLDKKISIISSDGEVITIKHAYMYISNMKNRNRPWKGKWISYDFDCENLDCALPFENVQELIKELEVGAYSLRVFVDQHDQSEEFVKVSFIDFVIENESNAWSPKEWVSSNVDTDIFEFQFVYQEKEKTLVKLDKRNEKYQWIVDKYENDPAVEIINIPTFKTIQRAIYTKNDKGSNKGIRTTEVLSKDYTNAYTLNDYHDLKGGKAKLFWKGYQSLYGGQTYCKDDFICADGELQLQIGKDIVPILRGDLIVLPESGPGYKFIFDDVDSMEIISILKDIPPKTNLFFENIIIPDDKGERVRLPLKFAYHLE